MNAREQILEVERKMGEAIVGQQTVIEHLIIAILADVNDTGNAVPPTRDTSGYGESAPAIELKAR